MIDPSTLLPGAPGPADFSAFVCYHSWTFGFAAYREQTCLLLGEEVEWVSIPSWLALILFLLLALAEYLVLRWVAGIARRWMARRGGRSQAAA